MNKVPGFLSKTNYLDGLRCPKLLWYRINRKDKIPPSSLDLQEIMKQGRIVGELVQKIFPEGIKIERDFDPIITDQKSFEALSLRKPLFEAGFVYKHGYTMADILVPAEKDTWDLIEVKSSITLREDHYIDVAFQKYVYEGRGIKIRRYYIMHVDRDYVRNGELELDKLFIKKNVSIEAAERVAEIGKNIEKMREMLKKEEPQIKIGGQCSYCPMENVCFDFLPKDNVFLLRGNKKVAFNLIEQGILKLMDIPEHYELNGKQQIQLKAHLENKPFIDRQKIYNFLNQLKYPIYYLDFETIAPAVPIYDNSRPFEDIPFQFSVHVQESEGTAPIHHAFLAEGILDPRPELLEKLKIILGEKGSIIAYSAEFEIRCLRMAARAYPEYTDWFIRLKARFVDLLTPFSDLAYYHPEQNGSASIKDVLPALTGMSYKDMTIKDGGNARYEYMRVTYDREVDKTDRENVRNALEKYCELDTLAMVRILDELRRVIKG